MRKLLRKYAVAPERLVTDDLRSYRAATLDLGIITLENHLRLLQINVVALTSLTRLFLPAMIARGGGRILNVASIAAFMPIPRLAAYAAAKAYVLSLTESLSQELSGTGVTATALCPGLTDTAMVRGSQMAKVVPAPMIMSPKDVAELGCSACLKGETICVPGLANRALTSGAQLLPRALVRSIGGMATVRGSGGIASAFFGGGAAGKEAKRCTLRVTEGTAERARRAPAREQRRARR